MTESSPAVAEDSPAAADNLAEGGNLVVGDSLAEDTLVEDTLVEDTPVEDTLAVGKLGVAVDLRQRDCALNHSEPACTPCSRQRPG